MVLGEEVWVGLGLALHMARLAGDGAVAGGDHPWHDHLQPRARQLVGVQLGNLHSNHRAGHCGGAHEWKAEVALGQGGIE